MKLQLMLDSVKLSEGFSWNLRENCAPVDGYAVSTDKDTERVFDHCPTALEIADYIVDNSFELLEYTYNDETGEDYTPVTVVGLWEDSGKWYMDVSDIVPSLDTAISLGKDNNQIAVFDIAKLESVYIDYSQENIILGGE